MNSLKASSHTEALRKAVQIVFEDRIAKACCNEETIIKLADAYANSNSVGIEQLLEEVDFYEVTDGENNSREELAAHYYAAKRDFEANFIKKHMTTLQGRIFGRWLAYDAAFEVVQDPDLYENQKLMEAIGADNSIKGIKPVK